MRISDWSSDVCSSDLEEVGDVPGHLVDRGRRAVGVGDAVLIERLSHGDAVVGEVGVEAGGLGALEVADALDRLRLLRLQRRRRLLAGRSEERRAGKECVRPGRSRWSPSRIKKN